MYIASKSQKNSSNSTRFFGADVVFFRQTGRKLANLGKNGGNSAKKQFANQINFHLYHYAGNNPVKFTDPDGFTDKNAVLPTVNNAFNLDFGMDYSTMAYENYKNGHPVIGTIQMLDSTCELTYDLFACYCGAKVFDTTIKAGIMLKSTLSALSSSSTVVLGRYSEGSCGGYTKMADKLGVSYFQLPDKMFKVLEKIKVGNSNLGKIINEKWLDGVIKSGARILLNFNPEGYSKESAYLNELYQLKESGYKFVKTCVEGIECWEAIK